jgi:hypothetical protein
MPTGYYCVVERESPLTLWISGKSSMKMILAILFLVGSVFSQAQVYEVRVGSTVGGGTLVYKLDHDWRIGTYPNSFGLLQFRSGNGNGALITYTTVHVASRQFTTQMPALTVAAIGLLAFFTFAAIAAMVLLAPRHRARARQADIC